MMMGRPRNILSAMSAAAMQKNAGIGGTFQRKRIGGASAARAHQN
jgi:hypothetical protein